MRRRYSTCLLIAIVSTAGTVLAQKDIKPPETFTANAQALGRNAGASAEVTIQINQYTSENDRKAIEEALRIGGFQGFLPALRSAPEVGYVEMNGRKSLVRWARQQPTDKGRTISIVTESPLAFVGGAAVDARPRQQRLRARTLHASDFEVVRVDLQQDEIGRDGQRLIERR